MITIKIDFIWFYRLLGKAMALSWWLFSEAIPTNQANSHQSYPTFPPVSRPIFVDLTIPVEQVGMRQITAPPTGEKRRVRSAEASPDRVSRRGSPRR